MKTTSESRESAEEFLRNYQLLVESSTGMKSHYGPEEHNSTMARLFGAREPTAEESAEMSRLASDMQTETDLLKRLSLQLLGTLKHEERRRLVRIPVGTLPVDRFNGRVMKTPSGEDLIVISAGLPATLFEIAQNFVGARSSRESPPEIPFHQATLSIFLHAFYQATGRLLTVPKRTYIDSPERRFTIGALWTNGVFFVLGHEYGHVLRGHLRNENLGQSLPGRRSAPRLLEYQRSQQQELEADEDGLRLAVRFAKSREGGGWAGVGILGVELVLQTLLMVESLGLRTSSTHPSATERLERIHALQEPLVDAYTSKLVSDMQRVFSITTEVGTTSLSKVQAAQGTPTGQKTPNPTAEADS